MAQIAKVGENAIICNIAGEIHESNLRAIKE